MTTPSPEVFVIGAGTVGTALAMKLSRAGIPVAGLHSRRAEQAAAASAMAGVLGTSGDYPHILTESDIVILAVRDEAISEVAADLVAQKVLAPKQVLLHCSGARAAADALGPAKGKVRGRGTMHPLISFADARLAAGTLRGATFTIEGDQAGRDAARVLALALGGKVVEIDGEKMALYHAAAVIACNYLVALADAGVHLLERAGFGKETALTSLLPLIGGTIKNLTDLGVDKALTGPIARGDFEVVKANLSALEESAPELLPLYREAGLRACVIAARAEGAKRPALAKIEALLGGGEGSGKPASKAPPKAPKAKKPRK